MERKILILLSFILIYPLIAYSSLYRVKGMNGEYYIPDAEYDAIYINPVLLSRIDGIHILSDISMEIYSQKKFEDDYLHTNFSSPTNDTRTTTTKSFNMDGTLIGFLYNRDNLGFGIVMEPDIYTYKQKIITDPNSETNDRFDTEETTERESGVLYNSKLLFSYSLESLILGFRAGYEVTPYFLDSYNSRTYTILTNRREDTSQKEKDQNKVTAITFELGAGFGNNKDMFFGSDIRYAILDGERKENTDSILGMPNYIATNDSYYLTGKMDGYSIGGNLLFEYRAGNDRLFRNIVSIIYLNSTTAYESSDEFKKISGYSNFKKEYVHKSIDLNLYTSFSKVYRSALTFIGLKFNYNTYTGTYNIDFDTTKDPLIINTEYKVTAESSDIGTTLVIGAEGAILNWLILRAAANMSLFLLESTTYTKYDCFVKENTSDTADKTLYLLNSLTLKAGTTIKFSDNINLDIASSFDIIGLNYSSRKNEWDKTRTTHNPVDTTDTIDFKINVGLTILL